jgi:hypothetical protein
VQRSLTDICTDIARVRVSIETLEDVTPTGDGAWFRAALRLLREELGRLERDRDTWGKA